MKKFSRRRESEERTEGRNSRNHPGGFGESREMFPCDEVEPLEESGRTVGLVGRVE